MPVHAINAADPVVVTNMLHGIGLVSGSAERKPSMTPTMGFREYSGRGLNVQPPNDQLSGINLTR